MPVCMHITLIPESAIFNISCRHTRHRYHIVAHRTTDEYTIHTTRDTGVHSVHVKMHDLIFIVARCLSHNSCPHAYFEKVTCMHITQIQLARRPRSHIHYDLESGFYPHYGAHIDDRSRDTTLEAISDSVIICVG